MASVPEYAMGRYCAGLAPDNHQVDYPNCKGAFSFSSSASTLYAARALDLGLSGEGTDAMVRVAWPKAPFKVISWVLRGR